MFGEIERALRAPSAVDASSDRPSIAGNSDACRTGGTMSVMALAIGRAPLWAFLNKTHASVRPDADEFWVGRRLGRGRTNNTRGKTEARKTDRKIARSLCTNINKI